MLKSSIAAVSAAIAVAVATPVLGDGGPQPDHSVVSWGLGAGQCATLLVVPDGSGPAFTNARDSGGSAADATIRLLLRDISDLPIVYFPAEDMWIESEDLGLVCCTGGGSADRNTDSLGTTEWKLPRRAGGHSQTSCRVFVNGDLVTGGANPMLCFNSPDINGDLAADLVDVGLFAALYYQGYAHAADLQFDNAVNLGDIVILARSLGARCH